MCRFNIYPWAETTCQDDSFGFHPDGKLSLWIGIIKDNDKKLLNELLKIHSINTKQCKNVLLEKKLLHLAAEYNAVESFKYLLEKYHSSHIDVNDIINIYRCCHCKQLVDMKESNSISKKTLLHYAVESNNETIVNILIDHGADVNITDNSGETPLHYAVQYNNDTIVNILVDHGADVNITDRLGETPLRNAVKNNNDTIVNILVDHGADVNMTDKSDDTSLHCAVKQGNET